MRLQIANNSSSDQSFPNAVYTKVAAPRLQTLYVERKQVYLRREVGKKRESCGGELAVHK